MYDTELVFWVVFLREGERECERLRRPEESVGPPASGVTSSGEMPHMCAENFPLVLCKSIPLTAEPDLVLAT